MLSETKWKSPVMSGLDLMLKGCMATSFFIGRNSVVIDIHSDVTCLYYLYLSHSAVSKSQQNFEYGHIRILFIADKYN